jgi:FkbH-like protein
MSAVPDRIDDRNLESYAAEGAWAEYFKGVAARLAGGEPSFALLNGALRQAACVAGPVDGFRRVKLGILRNATVEPWLPSIFGALLERGLLTGFWVGDFDVYEQYTLPSEHALDRHEVEVLLIHFDPRTFVGDARLRPPPDLHASLVGRIEGIVEGILGHWSGHILLSNLVSDPWDYGQPWSAQAPESWTQIRRAVNASLVERFSDASRVHILDVDEAVSHFGTVRAFDTRMHLTAASPFSVDFLPVLGGRIGRALAPLWTPPRKCVVVDLDNTLWGGILGEDGPEGVAIGSGYPGVAYREFQLYLKSLLDRGFVLAINSKNNPSDAVSFIEGSPDMVLRMEDFAAHRINWRDKVSNMRELADELNLGLDAMIFVDDSAVECDLVRAMLPMVQVERFPVEPLEILPFIASVRNLERLSVTEEDRKRGAAYRANAQREVLRREAPDLASFIRSLDINLAIRENDRDAIPRISQLTQRTNQFNLTTHRYDVDDVERFFREGWAYTMRMDDRFTDYGIIGLIIAMPEGENGAVIDTFLLSCRAFGRKVEDAFLRHVLRDLHGRGRTFVDASWIRTAKNEMTRDIFPSHGFEVIEEGEDRRSFRKRLTATDAHPDDELYGLEAIGS